MNKEFYEIELVKNVFPELDIEKIKDSEIKVSEVKDSEIKLTKDFDSDEDIEFDLEGDSEEEKKKKKEERRVIVIKEKFRLRNFLLLLISRLFVNLNFSKVIKYSAIQITILAQNNVIKLNNRYYLYLNYEGFKINLFNILNIEGVVKKIFTQIDFSNVLIESEEKMIDYDVLHSNIILKVINLNSELQRWKTYYRNNDYKQIKRSKKLKKLNFYLKDIELIKQVYKGIILNQPHLRRRQKTALEILKYIKKNKIIRLVYRVISKLLRRRKILWKHMNLMMRETEFFLIGKDYKVYDKKIGRTYISQTNKYVVTFNKEKQLNPKYVKCVELLFKKSFRVEYRRFFKYVLYINKMLHYFYKRFYKYLFKYSSIIFDKKFVIPYKGKMRSFMEIMDYFITLKKKEKYKLYLLIFGLHKHEFEKHMLKSLQKRRELPLGAWITIMENEKYYPKYRRTKIPPKIYKWLMKYVYDDMAIEYRDSYSRPRVILEKREESIAYNYPYVPKFPLKFNRDVLKETFKKTKPLKYEIIKRTRPRIGVVLQSSYFQYSKRKSKLISKNILRSKLNGKVHLPERIQRILISCENFYKNLLNKNFYKNFQNILKKFKILYLYNPEYKKKISSFISFFLYLSISPLFHGISAEREYAHQLKVFLNNYLTRLKIYKRYDLANSFCDVNEGYIIPADENLDFYKEIMSKGKQIMKKRPNYVFMRYMYRKSFKRLTMRIRSKVGAFSGIIPLFKYNLIGTAECSPINLKKRGLNKASHYLVQPNIDFKVKSKLRLYISALKRTQAYSAAYHTNAKLYYFSPYNLFLKKFDNELLPEEDFIYKYQNRAND